MQTLACARTRLRRRLLPPAYVVRREGNSFTLLVCPHLGGGGVPISHNALQHFPECHGADTGEGVPCQVQPGGGGTLPGGTLPDRVPPLLARSGWWGYPHRVPPRPGQDGGGGTQDNRRSTHYTAGGMPLAFTQEDFLV